MEEKNRPLYVQIITRQIKEGYRTVYDVISPRFDDVVTFDSYYKAQFFCVKIGAEIMPSGAEKAVPRRSKCSIMKNGVEIWNDEEGWIPGRCCR